MTRMTLRETFLIAAKSQGSEMVEIVEMTRMHRPRALEDLWICVTSNESISTSHDVQPFRVKARVSVLFFPTFHMVLPGPYSIYTSYALHGKGGHKHNKAPLLLSSPQDDNPPRDPRPILSLAVARQHV